MTTTLILHNKMSLKIKSCTTAGAVRGASCGKYMEGIS